MPSLLQQLAAAIREEERVKTAAARKVRIALEKVIDRAGARPDVAAKHGRRIAREDARMPEAIRNVLSPSSSSIASSWFTSPKGRTFSVGNRAVEQTRWGQRESFPILYKGKEAGEIWRDAFTYGPGIDGKGKWSASTRKLFWTHDAAGLKRGGYDIAAADTADACLQQWGHSADQILDFHARKV